ncbi:hypothetical protein B0T22DRAFT_23566 [Podospora appendiculata]|uniref:LysM domain-containing protein n=1 Tax=Podospora appendiculata TaxID=314037 RepID=A0AAE0XG08_9PEZI|nr:hypothetical protein B0T22DRAFT_23566 [Podospora appendiculata]
MNQTACCTCATLLPATPPRPSSEYEEPLNNNRQLECCSRIICRTCIHKNDRFGTYCLYCQISSGPSILPQGGLKDPPSYSVAAAAAAATVLSHPLPPPYTLTPPQPLKSSTTLPPHTYDSEKAALADADAKPYTSTPPTATAHNPAPDTLHFLDHAHDTIPSLSLRYNVSSTALRRANRLGSDHLLLGRQTILIPGGGVSLSPRPVEGEAEEARKAKIRRWMVACKVADYEVALLYLEQAQYDLDLATEAFFADEAWEREHPLGFKNTGEGGEAIGRYQPGKGMRLLSRGAGSRLAERRNHPPPGPSSG